MITLIPTQPAPLVPSPRPAPRPNPYPRPDRPTLTPTPTLALALALAKPCPGCGRVFCTCPRKDWIVTPIAAAGSTSRPGTSTNQDTATVQPGKGTHPPAGGGVRPPQSGWGGKKR